MVESIAQSKAGVVGRRYFHQSACHIDRIAGRGDVLVAVTSEPRCDDPPVMGADLESDT
jgi:hypothetical protein